MLRVSIAWCLALSIALSQSSPWESKGTATLNLTQVALKNWVGGGQNTIGIAGLLSYRALYNDARTRWETTLDVGYGLTKLADAPFRKSDDRFILISTAGLHTPDSLIQYALQLDFRTQLTDGFRYGTNAPDTLTSTLFAPATVNLGLGGTYTPSDGISLTLMAATGRAVLVLDRRLQDGTLGVDSGKAVRVQFGASLNATIVKEIIENVLLNTKLAVFAPYDAFTSQVVNWNTVITFRINKFLSANLALDVAYDPKVIITRDDGTRGPSVQLRNVFGLGITLPL
ncbi:MAG: hypothetical protein AA908_06580 [Chlorobi bacterium NICIL-2]|jgi:hypothetical protein|nr:MAG: hypothetical protein AA908_06580 [Chlorobi bacterium NICIL-2]